MVDDAPDRGDTLVVGAGILGLATAVEMLWDVRVVCDRRELDDWLSNQ